MDALDLGRPELEEVRSAWRKGRAETAIDALQRHFETRRLDPRLLWEPAANAAEHRRWADAALEGSFELQDASARPPRRADGGLDWHHRGPRDDPEWPRFLNRHDFFRSLLRSWRDTGDERYRHCINHLLVDWLDHVPPPRGWSLDPAWRSLEAARRATLPWLEVFFANEPEPALEPLPRFRMLLGILDHGRVLRHRHARFGNHLFTEVVALAVLAAAWPELRAARGWRDYALPRAVRILLRQTYPDGAHTELSNHYHRVVVMEAERLLAVLSLCERENEHAGRPGRNAAPPSGKDLRQWIPAFAGMTKSGVRFRLRHSRGSGNPRETTGHGKLEASADAKGTASYGELHAKVEARVRAMWDYFAGMTLPDGTGPLNNDGDREPNARYLRESSRRHRNPQWMHVASGGARGAAPPCPPSRFYPWAGQALMRDGWGHGAQWARFDMGPHGTAHQHADQLSLEVSLGDRHLLVDPGRYTYRPGPARNYMKGPTGHNVVRIDGRGAIEPPWRARAPVHAPALRTPRLDFFSHAARFPADPWRGRGGARWTRGIVYLRGKCWIVLDRLEVSGPSDVAASWLFHPDRRVEVRDGGAFTCDPGVPNLALLPLGAVRWRIEAYRGVRSPEWRGWYSDRYNLVAPCTQLEFRARVRMPVLAAWLLRPLAAGAPASVPAVEVHEIRPGMVRIEMDEDGGQVVVAALDGSSVAGLVPGIDGRVPCALSSA